MPVSFAPLEEEGWLSGHPVIQQGEDQRSCCDVTLQALLLPDFVRALVLACLWNGHHSASLVQYVVHVVPSAHLKVPKTGKQSFTETQQGQYPDPNPKRARDVCMKIHVGLKQKIFS